MKNKGIIKVERRYLSKIKAALTLINEMENNDIAITSKYVSGILKKAKSNL